MVQYELVSLALSKLSLPPGFLQFTLYVLSELFDNIREHSKADKISLKSEVADKTFSLSVLDNGIGLRQSYIKKNILAKDDKSAIEFALSGLSTKDTKERGYGLYSIRRAVEWLNGKMIIKSGKAEALISKNKIEFSREKKISKGVEITIKSEIKDVNFYKIIE